MWTCRLVKFCLVFVSVLVIAACTTSPEKKLIAQKCSYPGCHGTDKVYSQRYLPGLWRNTVASMRVKMNARGLSMTDEEQKTITDYLIANYGA